MLVVATTFPYYHQEYISNKLESGKKRRRVKQTSCFKRSCAVQKKKEAKKEHHEVLMMQVIVQYEDWGKRIEYLCLPLYALYASQPTAAEDDLCILRGDVLKREYGFETSVQILSISMSMKVEEWGCRQSHARLMQSEDGDYSIQLHLSDDLHKDIECIKVAFLEKEREKNVCPLYPKSAEIQNLCGSCELQSQEIHFGSFEKISKKKKNVAARSPEDVIQSGVSESLFSMSGTFVLCISNQKVDFRGVRSIRDVEENWPFISSMSLDSVVLRVYMIVLKGQIGKGIMFEDGCSYIINRVSWWCKCSLSYNDVCYSLTLSDIEWKKLFNSVFLLPPTSTALESKSVNLDISRRGGVVIRFIFEAGTVWNYKKENEVVYDSNRLLNVLHHMLCGKL